MLTKRSHQSDRLPESQSSAPPQGPFFTGSLSWMKSSARHTLSNRGLSEIHLRLVNLTEMLYDTLSKAPCLLL